MAYRSPKYQKRFYRDWLKSDGLYSRRIVIRETDLQILTDKPAEEGFLRDRVQSCRLKIEGYISRDRRFLDSLKPIAVELTAPPIVRDMAGAAGKAGVGPMAAVAGAIAQYLGRELLRKGYKDVIVENGGDIFLASRKVRDVGIYAGKLQPWRRIALRIKPQDTPLGICTSSGIIGHSLSFGSADGVVVLAKNVALADAVATATANLVNSEPDLSRAMAFSRSIRGVIGAVAIFRSSLAVWGDIRLVT